MGHATLWEWDAANKIWVEKPAVVAVKRMTAVGQVIAGAHKLYWVDCNPSAGLSAWELTDDLVGGLAIVLDEFHTSRESHMINLNPPMPFTTGIYLKTFTNMNSITFGYV